MDVFGVCFGDNMDQKITKRQHFVPQFYLKNFTCDNGKLTMYDRRKKKIINDVVSKDLCKVDYLYETYWENGSLYHDKYLVPNYFEKKFAKKESKYAILIQNIINICLSNDNDSALICDKNEKMLLASFAINMFFRNKWTMKMINPDMIMEEERKLPCYKAASKLFEDLRWRNPDALLKQAHKAILFDERMTGGTAYETLQDILKLNLTFFVSSEAEFLTSSFPTLYETTDDQEGITHLSKLYIPIHKHVAINYTDGDYARKYRNRKITILDKDVHKMNRKYLNYTEEQCRFIIGSGEEALKYVKTCD